MKRKFQITAGVLSIIVGALLTGLSLIAIFYLALLSDFQSSFGLAMNAQVGLLIFITALIAVCGIIIIVLASKLCQNRKSHGIAVALLVMISIITFFQLIGMLSEFSGFFAIVMLLTQLTSIGMLATYLALNEKVAAPHAVPAQPQTAPAQPHTSMQTNPEQSLKQRISIIRALRQNGDLTEEEYKEQLKKELNR